MSLSNTLYLYYMFFVYSPFSVPFTIRTLARRTARQARVNYGATAQGQSGMGADADLGRRRQCGQAERQGEVPAAHQHLGRVRQCSGNLVHTERATVSEQGVGVGVFVHIFLQPSKIRRPCRRLSLCSSFLCAVFFMRSPGCDHVRGSYYVFLIAL